MKRRSYDRHDRRVRGLLRPMVSKSVVSELHGRSPRRHARLFVRQVLVFGLTLAVLFSSRNPWITIPATILQGFNILGFTILLHEVVHQIVFVRPNPRAERVLAWIYAFPAGLSPTQFTRWHLDHHRELGSDTDDPKRAHLSPRSRSRLRRWLYLTPWLFVIYARAAARESATYPAEVRRQIACERAIMVALHLLVVLGLCLAAGIESAARVWMVPLFVAFPPAFVLNRLGQHYDIDPSQAERFSTRVDGNVFWRWIFLNSNYHIEHHYYPAVPLYHLHALNRHLQHFFTARKIPNRTYGQLLRGWFLRNQQPHSRWDTHP